MIRILQKQKFNIGVPAVLAMFLAFQDCIGAMEESSSSQQSTVFLPLIIVLALLLLGVIFFMRRRVKSFEQKVLASHDVLEVTLERTKREVEKVKQAYQLVALFYYEYDVINGTFTGDDGFYQCFAGEAKEYLTLDDIMKHVHPEDLYFIDVFSTIHSNEIEDDTMTVEGRICDASGALKYMRVYIKSYFDEYGNLASRRGCMLDVTEEKQREIELSRTNKQFEYIQKLAKIYTWKIEIANPEYINVSREFFETVGKEYQGNGIELIESFKQILDKGDYQTLINGINNLIYKKRRFDITLPIYPKNESEVLYIHIRSFTSEENPFISDGIVMGVIHDITELKKAEQKVGHSERMKALGKLASGIAHDFNNQLSGILGFAELIKTEEISDKVAEYSDMIIDRGEKSSELVNKLLDFSKTQKEEAELVDVNELLNDSVSFFSHLVGKSVIIKKETFDSKLGVLGNFNELQNVILNLGINSKDALGNKGGEIVFDASSAILNAEEASKLGVNMGKYVLLTVTDNGEGMIEEVRNKAMDPFFTTKNEGAGTGLGLSTVHSTVSSLGGNLKIESKPGDGTKVSLYLPAVSSETVIETRKIKRESELQIGEGRVLIIDDDKTLVKLVTMQLEKAGYCATGFGNPVEAVEHYKNNHFKYDLVILDMIMPEMNGAEVFKELKSINSEVKTIIMSGYSGEELFEVARKEGLKNFLSKPVTLTALTKMVSEVLGGTEQEVGNEI